MKLLTSLTIIATFMLSTGVEGARYRLKTDLKPGQPGKERFSDLYLEAYHTGAGLDDAVMVPNATAGIVGYLNGTVGHSGNITCTASPSASMHYRQLLMLVLSQTRTKSSISVLHSPGAW